MDNAEIIVIYERITIIILKTNEYCDIIIVIYCAAAWLIVRDTWLKYGLVDL